MLLAGAYPGKAPGSFDLTSSAYIHIPFCRRRCFYCDFPISVVGDKPLVKGVGSGEGGVGEGRQEAEDREQQGGEPSAVISDRINGSNSGTIAHYVDQLCQEIGLTSSRGKPLQTIFFGGGTPSLLSVKQVERILGVLERQFGMTLEAEISMEIDPGTFDLAQVQGYRQAGVNRVSLGVQAFQPELLQVCGRSHTVPEVYIAVEQVQQAGFENFSLDLISGLPHQTLAHWQESLEKAIALSPTHLSCYDLTVEAGTPFSRQFKPGLAPLPADETTAEMYRLAQRTLTAAGYDHYEISNYAQPGYQCQHNRVYWENRSFYGFGMGATSYLDGDRVSRPRKTREYYEWVKARQKAAAEATETQRQNDAENSSIQNSKFKIQNSNLNAQNSPPSSDLLLDTLMLGLRLAEGLNLARLQTQFGEETVAQILTCLKPYIQKGWVEITSAPRPDECNSKILSDKGRLRLTDPEGFLFSNVILVSLFDELG